MIDDVIAVLIESGGQMLLGDGHADSCRKALSEGTGRGLDAGGYTVFRVSGSLGSPLSEVLDVVERKIVAGQMQEGIEEHRSVSAGKDEAVAVEPFRIIGIMFEEVLPYCISDRRCAERCSGMSGFCLIDGVSGQESHGVDA